MQFATEAGAMRGLKVLDFSMGVAGPHAAFLCAEHGADVVKIEPHGGDWCRDLGRRHGDMSAFFVVYNRGKRSVSIDMKDKAGREAVRAMALQADVIVEAFRPGVMAKFGLDYGTLAVGNPSLIYLSVNGFGSVGPLVDAPATDVIVQAFSGIMYMNRSADGTPQRIDHVMVDVLTGLYAFQALSAALLDQARHGGSGRHIECSMLKASAAFQAGKIVEDVLEGGELPLYVPLGIFSTADGRISMSVRRDDHFATLCRSLGRSDLLAGGRYSSGAERVRLADELLPQLRAEFAARTTDELTSILSSAGILHSRVNSYADLAAHAQTRAAGVLEQHCQGGIPTPLPMAVTPGVPRGNGARQAPHIGQHSLEALHDWGLPQAALDALQASGAIREPGKASRPAVPTRHTQ